MHQTRPPNPTTRSSKKTKARKPPPRRKPTREQRKARRHGNNPTRVRVQPMTDVPKTGSLAQTITPVQPMAEYPDQGHYQRTDRVEWHPARPDFDFGCCLAWLWSQLLTAGMPLDPDDPVDQIGVRENLERYFSGALHPDAGLAFEYVGRGQAMRLRSRRRSNRISEARDQRNEALAQLLDKQAQSFKTQSQTLRSHKSTLEKLTDRSWAEGLRLGSDSDSPPGVADFFNDDGLM